MSTAPTTQPEDELRQQVIDHIYEWIRDCGLDIQDIEPFVDREVMPLIHAHTTPRANSNKNYESVYIRPANVNESDITHPEDEKRIYEIWEIVKNDSLASSRIGSPSKSTRDAIIRFIHDHDTARDQALLTELLDMLPHFKVGDTKLLPPDIKKALNFSIDQLSSLLTRRLGKQS